jgi:hypothetical protein
LGVHRFATLVRGVTLAATATRESTATVRQHKASASSANNPYRNSVISSLLLNRTVGSQDYKLDPPNDLTRTGIV